MLVGVVGAVLGNDDGAGAPGGRNDVGAGAPGGAWQTALGRQPARGGLPPRARSHVMTKLSASNIC